MPISDAHQTVDREVSGQEQRQHIGGEEQHGDQRHAAPELDERDRENPDQRNGRAPAQRERDPDRHRGDDAGDRHHQRHQQAAPQPGIDQGNPPWSRPIAAITTPMPAKVARLMTSDAPSGANAAVENEQQHRTIAAVAAKSTQTGWRVAWI